MVQIENQTKYGLTKKANFAIVLLKNANDNDIEMYSIHNERKSVVGERFIEL